MYFVNFYKYLHEAHKAIRAGPTSLDVQAVAINDLFLFLDNHRTQRFPSLLYTQAMQMLQWYREHVLPNLEGYNEEDRQEITENYKTLIASMNESSGVSQNIENALYQVIQKLVTGTFHHEHEVETALVEIARNFPGIEDIPRTTSIFQTFLRRFRSVQKEFNYTQTLKLFERLLDVSSGKSAELSLAHQSEMSNFREMFEYVLRSYFEGKVVLVDHFGHGIVMPLWVSVDCARTSEHVEFWNHTVDAEMQASADTARSLACTYLIEECDREIPEQTAVQCQFPNPAVGYRDTSASLLIGIKIVGEVLGLESDPATAVTGEVEHFGNVLGVGWIPEKMNAAREHEGIKRILVPEANIGEIKPRPQEHQLTIVPVRTFPETVQRYYGEQLQKKIRWQVSRRQIVKIAAGLVAVPGIFAIVKNLFLTSINPVTECDLRLLECARDLYQKKSDYRSAITILDAILARFRRDQSLPAAIQIKAFALGQLGVIYVQQQRIEESLRAFYRAVELWNVIHDRENLADVLLRIGDVYRHTVEIDGSKANSVIGLRYYQEAKDLLNPSMQTFHKLCGRYYTLSGYMYSWVEENDLAKTYCEQGVKMIAEPETNWTYQTAKQQLGSVLMKIGDYDNAYDLLQSTTRSPVLQGPHDQAGSFLALSNLFFSIGEHEKGLEFVSKAKKLCREFGLKGQQHILTNILTRRQLPPSGDLPYEVKVREL
jgi:tetratricopeptide (TPR) repeat protein